MHVYSDTYYGRELEFSVIIPPENQSRELSLNPFLQTSAQSCCEILPQGEHTSLSMVHFSVWGKLNDTQPGGTCAAYHPEECIFIWDVLCSLSVFSFWRDSNRSVAVLMYNELLTNRWYSPLKSDAIRSNVGWPTFQSTVLIGSQSYSIN